MSDHPVPENTTASDPLLHFVGLLSGSDSYITGMESAGQRQLVASTTLPTKAPWDELTALGFTRGDDVPGDPIFCTATLPDGWTKKATDHAMWSVIVDTRGVEMVSVFYKAAFYDRSAHMHITCPGAQLATQVLYGDDAVKLPAEWDVLTPAEREDFWDDVAAMQENITKHPTVYGKYQPRVDALLLLNEAASA